MKIDLIRKEQTKNLGPYRSNNMEELNIIVVLNCVEVEEAVRKAVNEKVKREYGIDISELVSNRQDLFVENVWITADDDDYLELNGANFRLEIELK